MINMQKISDIFINIMEEKQMAFQLNNVVPWGRNFAEYRLMFNLSDDDLKKKIAGFGEVSIVRQNHGVTV